ncbi:hypothetical protein TGPRC2_307070 [Toxoplasma gondii TgCatPRC2]|uniref:Uncharacterized protein n=10 Tax=Toxoplasma gondii TaxID=5811 RepID=A0A125YR43_TOXGV|nr:hypothetical protein TGME49_307070 [Toxoplasma gondii ME49]ESS28261.1 hypothetical protein TGVEG_307070 [Toxoplasma gondii VEG]KFG29444.1 hypothetical protein TGDOM2_307070 [Toxoplasma gondii GAB2-2007-GAL-DOM2]KFG32546.1 hypothetical protein TGFOU_307070 [Toxoplasma gondii FOU]KFH01656.1 hypothetical protein TGMAS_307070 [Toxoplasma gondii MAS]KYF47290.1 hypothetical protein TGARI_307070 [Toxoplasma gondii ARI]KYK62636.1 hypothetical protein TGPRC2_307070 [Toxoplasma gondii TgCatPRC2]PIL|eukprot:XP_018635663.1 hypothetical protein TGME49_307070 [Toxoplasma gondii ME49]
MSEAGRNSSRLGRSAQMLMGLPFRICACEGRLEGCGTRTRRYAGSREVEEVEFEVTFIGWVLRGTRCCHDGSGRCVPLVDGAHYKGVGHPIMNVGVAINDTPSSLATTSGQGTYARRHSLCTVLLQWVHLICANPQ